MSLSLWCLKFIFCTAEPWYCVISFSLSLFPCSSLVCMGTSVREAVNQSPLWSFLPGWWTPRGFNFKNTTVRELWPDLLESQHIVTRVWLVGGHKPGFFFLPFKRSEFWFSVFFAVVIYWHFCKTYIYISGKLLTKRNSQSLCTERIVL